MRVWFLDNLLCKKLIFADSLSVPPSDIKNQATYMLADSINHGINLASQVSLQYLYYLDQVSTSNILQ